MKRGKAHLALALLSLIGAACGEDEVLSIRCSVQSHGDSRNPCCTPGREVRDQPDGTCGCESPDPESEGDATALIEGFGVPPLELVRDKESAPAAFSWPPDEDTRLTRCALFGCQPKVLATQDDRAPSGVLKQIVNAHTCVLGFAEFRGQGGVFALGDSGIYEFAFQGGEKTDAVCGEPSDWRSRIPSRLLVGCWSFDEGNISAASELVPVSVADLGRVRITSRLTSGLDLRTDADCSVSRPLVNPTTALTRLCDLPEGENGRTSLIGACYRGKCRPKCIDDADCTIMANLLGPPDGTRCIHSDPIDSDDTGADEPPSPLGICFPLLGAEPDPSPWVEPPF